MAIIVQKTVTINAGEYQSFSDALELARRYINKCMHSQHDGTKTVDEYTYDQVLSIEKAMEGFWG